MVTDLKFSFKPEFDIKVQTSRSVDEGDLDVPIEPALVYPDFLLEKELGEFSVGLHVWSQP